MRSTRRARIKVLVGVLGIAVLASACRPAVAQGPAPCDAPSGPTDPSSIAIFNRTNADRAYIGIRTLAWNRQLYCLAVNWSQTMAASGSLRHRDLGAVINSPGYESYRTLGENILRGPQTMTGDQMHDAWMASPSHRQNIASTAYTSIGIGLAVSPDGSQVYATENFGG